MKRSTLLLTLLPVLLLATGCTSRSYLDSAAYQRSAQNWSRSTVDPAPPHDRPMFIARGENAGKPLHWPALRDAMNWAHVVVLGERHNDQVGHDTKVEIVKLYNGRAALAMEQFTRDQQVYVDDWRLDIGVSEERDAFEILQSRTDLWNDFESFYLPFIEVAKERGWPVVASNAPRQYVRLARTDGYATLRNLTPEQRDMFTIPRVLPGGDYRDRFDEVMSGLSGHGEEEIDLDALYRSQALWDATMADSVQRTRKRHPGTLVFHVNGAFHSDYDGGLVALLHSADPFAHVLNISLIPKDATELEEDDYGVADIVIYTGEVPEPEMPEEMPEGMEDGMDEGTHGEGEAGPEKASPHALPEESPHDLPHDLPPADPGSPDPGTDPDEPQPDDPGQPAHPPIDLPEK
jgi:uncharacterized iron-regulated protein